MKRNREQVPHKAGPSTGPAKKSVRGRGALSNPHNRFETVVYEPDPEADPSQNPKPITVLTDDHTQSIITYADSPDTGYRAGINPYRGCEHGCIYCFARPNHEYLGFSSGLDFETKIVVKRNAARILRKELMSPRYKPQVIGMCGNTDPYQPIERRLEITRSCLEVFAEFRNPVVIITKNRLVERDLDLFREMNKYQGIAVNVSVTSLDPKVARTMEPRASRPKDRLRAISNLHNAGIPVAAMVAPIVPGLNDSEIPSLVKACAEAGAQNAGYIIVRLPHAVKIIFEEWLEEHFPERKNKILNRIRAIRGGKLNDPNFHTRMSGKGIFAEQIRHLFYLSCKKNGLPRSSANLSTSFFRRVERNQLQLFD